MATYDQARANEEAAAAMIARREQRDASDRALEQFFAAGGEVQQFAFGKSGRVEGASYSAWGKPKKAAAAAPEELDAAANELDTPADDAEEV